VKLGKLAARHDVRTLRLERYIKNLPIPPDDIDWGSIAAPYPMFMNDSIGDCTCAAAAHLIEVWTKNAQVKESELRDSYVLRAYENISGYDPQTGLNDNGAVGIDVLNYWRKRGIGNHRILAYAKIETSKRLNVFTACWLFGGIYVGIQLPNSAQKQLDNKQDWSIMDSGVDSAPGSWGGHAISISTMNADALTCITWGQTQRMTWEFFNAYCDEAYAILSRDWLRRNQAPNGFAITELLADLTEIT